MRLSGCLVVLAVPVVLVACASLRQAWSPGAQREGVSSSLVDYLYPNGEVPPELAQDIPRLNLPLRVGIAFVPQRYTSTRKLLFRAPGTDVQTMRSTFVESEMNVQEGRSTRFAAAMANMTENLALELATFQERLKTEPQLAEVKWSDKMPRGGGGSMDPLFLFILMFLLIVGRHDFRSTGNDFFTRRLSGAGIHCKEYML